MIWNLMKRIEIVKILYYCHVNKLLQYDKQEKGLSLGIFKQSKSFDLSNV